jgi:hypothetical protein
MDVVAALEVRSDWLDLGGSPGLVEERLLGAVEAKDEEESLAGIGLQPVRFLAGGCGAPAEAMVRPATQSSSNSLVRVRAPIR